MSYLLHRWELMARHDCNPLQSNGDPMYNVVVENVDARRTVHACAADWIRMKPVHMCLCMTISVLVDGD